MLASLDVARKGGRDAGANKRPKFQGHTPNYTRIKGRNYQLQSTCSGAIKDSPCDSSSQCSEVAADGAAEQVEIVAAFQ